MRHLLGKLKKLAGAAQHKYKFIWLKLLYLQQEYSLTIQGVAEVFRSIICIQTGHWPARMVVAEETEQILMRTAQDEDQKDVI